MSETLEALVKTETDNLQIGVRNNSNSLNGVQLGLHVQVKDVNPVVQIAGVYSKADKVNHGVQIAGFGSEITEGVNYGVQIAGVCSVVFERVNHGVQIAGVYSLANKINHGVQIAGSVSGADSVNHGVQIAGVASGTDVNDGVQIAGVASGAYRVNHGVQIAGVCSVAGKINYGIQIATATYAGSGDKYLQLGLLNIRGDGPWYAHVTPFIGGRNILGLAQDVYFRVKERLEELVYKTNDLVYKTNKSIYRTLAKYLPIVKEVKALPASKQLPCTPAGIGRIYSENKLIDNPDSSENL